MARPLREISSTGIYHVMLRGINRQVIFEHPVDYRKFIDLLCLMVSPSDELGRSLPSLCRIYAYFVTLLRYVHQNPVAGGLCQHVVDYEWSSWGEYIGKSNDIPRICSVSAILRWKPIEELRELVNEPLPKTIQVIDFDRRRFSARGKIFLLVHDLLKTQYLCVSVFN